MIRVNGRFRREPQERPSSVPSLAEFVVLELQLIAVFAH